jgi:hypothetical protein
MENKICPDCGKEVKNLGAHDRFCLKKTPIKEVTKSQPEEHNVNKILIEIGKSVEMDDVAWFMVEDGSIISKPLEYLGSYSDENSTIPALLVMSPSGTYLPLFMIDGFCGIFPRDHEFVIESDQPAMPVVHPEPKPEVQATNILPEQEKIIQKKSLFGFLNKPTQKEEEPNTLSKETMALLKQIPSQK